MTIRTRVLYGMSIAAAVAAALTVAFAITIYTGISLNTALLDQAGRVRGTVQRLAKDELGLAPPALLVAEVDAGIARLGSAMADNRAYREANDALLALDSSWQDFKAVMRSVRGRNSLEYRQDLLAMSEVLWFKADKVVTELRASSDLILTEARYLLVSLGALLGLAIGVALLARSHVAGRLEAMSYSDHLTGLFNRRFFDAVLEQEVRRAERSGETFALICFDLDDFKRINDRAGHPAGDRSLVAVTRTVAQAMRKSDLLFRLGGDEFAALLPATGASEGLAAAEKARLAVAALPPVPGAGQLSISAGVSAWSTGKDPATLLKEADDALYLAKQGGRNRSIQSD
jgi:diguanylate cyclase (GGDEF)-like protein